MSGTESDSDSSSSDTDSEDDFILHEGEYQPSGGNSFEAIENTNDVPSSSHSIESTDSNGNNYLFIDFSFFRFVHAFLKFYYGNIIEGREDLIVVVAASSTQRTEIDDLIARLSNASSKSNSENSKIPSDVLRSLLEQIRNYVNTGVFETKEKNNGNKKRMSNVWEIFHLIFIKESGRQVPSVNWCTSCREVVFNLAHDGGTNYLRRHKCHKSHQITSYMPPKKKQKLNETYDNLLRNACVDFVAKDIRPFKAIEGSGLKELLGAVSEITKKYPMITKDDLNRFLPTERTVRKDLNERALMIRKYISQLFLLAIANVGGFSCTTDMWTDNFQHEKYICFTAHMNFYEKDEFISENFVFYVDVMDSLFCTAEKIQTKIYDVFAEFGVSKLDVINKIIFTTDRGSNIKSALKPPFKRIFCTAHYISNLVGSMCKIDEVVLIVKNAAKLVKYLKRSGLNSNKEMAGSSVKSYCKTRWNTVHDMLKSIVLNYSKIINILQLKESEDKSKRTKVLDKLLCLSREKMENIVDFLEFFKKITQDIEYEQKPIIHRIWPLFVRIDSYLERQDVDSNLIAKMKEAGQKYVQLPENINDMRPSMELKLTVFLHPLMKGIKFASEIEKNYIRNEAKNLMEAMNSISEPLNEQQRQVVDVNDNIRVNNEQSIIDEFCDDAQLFDVTTDDSSLNADTELTNYLNYRVRLSPNQNMDNFDHICWWISNKKSFPRLFAIFLRLSAIQATSASSERCFSNTGSIKTAKRASLKSSTINNLMLARAQFKLNLNSM